MTRGKIIIYHLHTLSQKPQQQNNQQNGQNKYYATVIGPNGKGNLPNPINNRLLSFSQETLESPVLYDKFIVQWQKQWLEIDHEICTTDLIISLKIYVKT